MLCDLERHCVAQTPVHSESSLVPLPVLLPPFSSLPLVPVPVPVPVPAPPRLEPPPFVTRDNVFCMSFSIFSNLSSPSASSASSGHWISGEVEPPKRLIMSMVVGFILAGSTSPEIQWPEGA